MRRLVYLFLWILLIVALAAVVYFVWVYFINRDNEIAVDSTVQLDCSSECSDHGQCGTNVSAAETEVVLGGQDWPMVEKHDRFFPVGFDVTIKDKRSERVKQANGREFDQQFSRVEWRNSIGDIQKTGWVADWCIK